VLFSAFCDGIRGVAGTGYRHLFHAVTKISLFIYLKINSKWYNSGH